MHTRSIAAMFGLILMSVLLIACAGCDRTKPSSPQGAGSGASENETEQGESRFAVFSPAIGVMLQGLGFEDSIVGRHTYDTALSHSIPVIGSHLDVDYEMLITLEPTDVFFERNTVEIPERVRMLADEHGWRIWTYELNTLDDIAATIDDLYLKLVGFQEAKITDDNFLKIDIDPTSKFDVDLPSARLARSWSPIGRAAQGAGRTLILAGVDPPGAMGPGSFHAQLIGRLGLTPAITTGSPWQELDYEDIIELSPDSILIFLPRARDAADQIGEPDPMTWTQVQARIGGLGALPIPAAEHQRIAIIEHPLGLLPSSSLGQVGDEIAKVVRDWHARVTEP